MKWNGEIWGRFNKRKARHDDAKYKILGSRMNLAPSADFMCHRIPVDATVIILGAGTSTSNSVKSVEGESGNATRGRRGGAAELHQREEEVEEKEGQRVLHASGKGPCSFP